VVRVNDSRGEIGGHIENWIDIELHVEIKISQWMKLQNLITTTGMAVYILKHYGSMTL
jgi:hypothetical protein